MKHTRKLLSLLLVLALVLSFAPMALATDGDEPETEQTQTVEPEAETPAEETEEEAEEAEPETEPEDAEPAEEAEAAPAEAEDSAEEPEAAEDSEPVELNLEDAELLGDPAMSGSCGTNATWALTLTSTESTYKYYKVTISGTGAMTDYDDSSNKAPWLTAMTALDEADTGYTHIIIAVEIQEGLTSVGAYAFYGSASIEIVSIEVVSLPTTLTTLGEHAFERSATNGTSMDLDMSGCTSLRAIPASCFSAMALSTLVLPSGLESIGNNAFNSSTLPDSLVIPDSVTTLGNGCFYYTTTHSIVLPASLQAVGPWAFWKVRDLCFVDATRISDVGSLHFTENYRTGETFSTRSAGVVVFFCRNSAALTNMSGAESEQLKTVVASSMSCGDSLTWTMEYTGAETVDEVDYKTYTVTISGTGAMYDYDASANLSPWLNAIAACNTAETEGYTHCIAAVVVDEGVTGVGAYAFTGAGTISSVSLPSTLTTLGESAFYGVGSGGTSVAIDLSECTGLRILPANCFSSAVISAISLPDGLVEIGTSAFNGSQLPDIVALPDSVTTIGNNAFWYIRGCVTLVLPANLQRVGHRAFGGMMGLYYIDATRVDNPAVVYTGSNELRNVTVYSRSDCAMFLCRDDAVLRNIVGDDFGSVVCVEVSSIDCGENLTWALECTGSETLDEISYKNYTLTISGTGAMTDYETDGLVAPWIAAMSAFNTGETGDYTHRIADVIVGEGVTGIGAYAFYKCSTISSVSLPSTLTTLGTGSFYEASRTVCLDVLDLSMCTGLREIPNDCFSSMHITDLVLPGGLEGIGGSAFNTSRIDNGVVIPDSVTTIGNNAFWFGVMPKVVLPAGLQRVGHKAFGCVRELRLVDATRIANPAGLTYTGRSADNGLTFAKDSEICDTLSVIVFCQDDTALAKMGGSTDDVVRIAVVPDVLSMDGVTFTAGALPTLADGASYSGTSKTVYTNTGWNSEEDGSGTPYGSDLTASAVWYAQYSTSVTTLSKPSALEGYLTSAFSGLSSASTVSLADASYSGSTEVGGVLTLINTADYLVTVDLAGKTVYADGIVTFGNVAVIDSVGGGLVAAEKGHIYLGSNSGYLAVYDSSGDTDGYRLVPLETKKAQRDTAYTGSGYKFTFYFDTTVIPSAVNSIIRAGKSSSDVSAWARISWTETNGTVSMDFPFADSSVKNVFGGTSQFFIIVKSIGRLSGKTLTVTPVMKFGSNSEVTGTAINMLVP